MFVLVLRVNHMKMNTQRLLLENDWNEENHLHFLP